jgi:hypothetical protein
LLKTGRFWVSCAVSLLCLWLAFRHIPVGEVVHLLAGAHCLLLLAALAADFLAVVARAWRWVAVLQTEAALTDSFWAQGVGFLFTNVFPLRLGEPARVLVMSERCGLPVMQVTASAIVERLLDAATNVLVLVLVLRWMRVPPLMRQAGMSFGGIALTGLLLLLLLVRFRHHSESLVQALCARVPFLPAKRIMTWWKELISGFLPLTRGRVALQAIAGSLVAWALSLAMFWCVLRAFHADGTLVEAAFMMVALSFAMSVPSSPGFVGVFQLVGQQALVLPFGAKYDAVSALAITLTVHLTYYLLTTTLGVIGLWRLGESFAKLGQKMTGRRAACELP